jgi:hypothetical protein
MKLLKNEELKFTHLSEAVNTQMSDEVINDKYAKGDVRIVTEQARYPLSSIVTMLQSGNYDLNPEFQRRHRWSKEQKSRLIESLIMNVPIPPIFLYEDKYSHYEVMDGLQRLTAIKEFYKNELVLQGLQEWPELNGKKYTELPDQVAKGIDRRYLSSIILLQETAKAPEEAQRLKQLVFERINSGGVKLGDQESRNAIYDGPLNKLCIRLARNIYLCKTWGIPEPTKSEIESGEISDELISNPTYQDMGDVELVLRFFAYRQKQLHNTSTLYRYFDYYLQYGNLFKPDVISNLGNIFEKTIKLAYDLFGDKAFWLWRKRKNTGAWGWYKKPAIVVYDPIMYVLSHYVDKSDKLLSKQITIRAAIRVFYENNYDIFEGRNVNPSMLEARDTALKIFFEEFMTK